MHLVRASMILGSQRDDTARNKAAGLSPTLLMPGVQNIEFAVYVQEFIKDGNHHGDYVSLTVALRHCDRRSPDARARRGHRPAKGLPWHGDSDHGGVYLDLVTPDLLAGDDDHRGGTPRRLPEAAWRMVSTRPAA
jgi:hypothetical protein